MQRTIVRKIKMLEDHIGTDKEDIEIVVRFIGVDENRRSYASGGLLIRQGQSQEELSASFFDNEDINAKTI